MTSSTAMALNCFYDPTALLLLLAMDASSDHNCSRSVCIELILFSCARGINSHFSVDHSITGKLVSNLAINNCPEEAHTCSSSHSSLDESSLFHTTSVR